MQSWAIPAATGALGCVVGWFLAKFATGFPAAPHSQGRSAIDPTGDEIRALMTQLKADCESFLGDIHRRIMVKDIAAGSLPASITHPDLLDEVYSDLRARPDNGWDQMRDKLDKVRVCLVGLRACHVVAVLRDQKASLGMEHSDPDYADLTAKLSELIARVDVCLCTIDHGSGI